MYPTAWPVPSSRIRATSGSRVTYGAAKMSPTRRSSLKRPRESPPASAVRTQMSYTASRSELRYPRIFGAIRRSLGRGRTPWCDGCHDDAMNWTLEVVVVPVSDIDRAKTFYADGLGFHLDHDIAFGDNRIVQLTPPGSGCSVVIGKGAVAFM